MWNVEFSAGSNNWCVVDSARELCSAAGLRELRRPRPTVGVDLWLGFRLRSAGDSNRLAAGYFLRSSQAPYGCKASSTDRHYEQPRPPHRSSAQLLPRQSRASDDWTTTAPAGTCSRRECSCWRTSERYSICYVYIRIRISLYLFKTELILWSYCSLLLQQNDVSLAVVSLLCIDKKELLHGTHSFWRMSR